MIYSNFLFMILRLIVIFLGEKMFIWPNIYGASMTILYVLDTVIALTIYIVPKCFEARKDPANHISRGSAVLRSSGNISGVSGQLSAGFSSSSINNDSTHWDEEEEYVDPLHEWIYGRMVFSCSPSEDPTSGKEVWSLEGERKIYSLFLQGFL